MLKAVFNCRAEGSGLLMRSTCEYNLIFLNLFFVGANSGLR
jgi:hypothetical protein